MSPASTKTQVSESKTRLRNIYKKFDKSVGLLTQQNTFFCDTRVENVIKHRF